MKAHEVLDQLIEMAGVHLDPTVDTLKLGDNDKETKKVAFCFTATPDVIRKATAWGADVIITHEPTFYDHFDNFKENAVTVAKKKLLDESGVTVYRYHDHPHFAADGDMIHKGFLKKVGFEGKLVHDAGGSPDSFFDFDKPITPREAADIISHKLKICHVRIIGAADVRVTKALLCLGACGDIGVNTLRDTDREMVISGEDCEWKNGCFVRDAAELGMKKALILLGHCASERDGMEYIRDMWDERYGSRNGVESRYFQTPDLFV